jgi:hypothetical protein
MSDNYLELLMRMLKKHVYAVVFAAALFVSGCPTIQVADVGIKPATLVDESFTMTVSIVVDEPDDPVDKGGQQAGGRGLIGVWLQDGWKATRARVRLLGKTESEELEPAAETVDSFPASFPYAPGNWWLFASTCQYVPQGASQYVVELDVEIPRDAKNGIVGIIPAVYSEKLELPDPIEAHIDLDKQTASILRPSPRAAVQEKTEKEPESDMLFKCPVKQVRPGPRGCACDAAGAGGTSLISVILALIRA